MTYAGADENDVNSGYIWCFEVQQPIKIHPFAVCDYALRKFSAQQEVFSKLDDIYRNVKGTNGHLVTVFSNELLGGKHKINWIELYQFLLKRYYV